jgi:hypothetical protein
MSRPKNAAARRRIIGGVAGVGVGLSLVATSLLGAGPAAADPLGRAYGAQEVDQSQLVPTTLDSTFAPFDCRMTPNGPVCSGERHLDEDWVRVDEDFGCAVPVYDKYVSDRYQTRYYNEENLNFFRRFRTTDVDYLSTDPSGPATATISSRTRFVETFDVPGDDDTMTITTSGLVLDIRAENGAPLIRITGTLVEPYDAPATFTGRALIDGVSTRHVNAPYDDVLPGETFAATVCQAATG